MQWPSDMNIGVVIYRLRVNAVSCDNSTFRSIRPDKINICSRNGCVQVSFPLFSSVQDFHPFEKHSEQNPCRL